ncbi:MAG TPA: hypothetical protein VKU00_02040 [Chthonomonadaceae bacterium]|nr:hypothetical protein [Chthonomonadaceae bacterium]
MTPLRERRLRATRWYVLRVLLLLLLIGGLTYSAWFAPWAKLVQEVQVEVTH